MPEDPITQGALAALTRRFEQAEGKNDREFGIVKSDLTALRLQVGNLDQKVGHLDHKFDGLFEKVSALSGKLDAFITEQRSVNTTLMELLSTMVDQNPDQK